MKKALIVAEKPSVARDIAKVLPGRFSYHNGYAAGDDYIVTWALGHLLSLAEPEHYNPELKKWKMDLLPIIPATFKLCPSQDKEQLQQLRIIKNLMQRSDVGEVINACDAGREGELIFRWVYAWAGCRKPVRRLWLSETTPLAVRKAFEAMRPAAEYDFLAAAAQLRAEADWLVGMNASCAISIAQRAQLRVGRVQTPTLALVVAREQEIRSFIPRDYYELWAAFRTAAGEVYRGRWFSSEADSFEARDQAESIARQIDGAEGIVTDVERRDKSEPPPLLYNLTDLQKDANRLYGLAAEDTLAAAQVLYETHKLLTYPRTESRHLTESLATTLGERLCALGTVPEFAHLVKRIGSWELPRRFVDDTRVGEHHALIPTGVPVDMGRLDRHEALVFDLVARRFLAAFFPDGRFRDTVVLTAVGTHTFISKGREELERGWRVVYEDRSEDRWDGGAPVDDSETDTAPSPGALPVLVRGQEVTVTGAETVHKRTRPPSRYTEGTLLAAMENAGRFVDDAGLRRTLKAVGGIGTVATRAAIIAKLIQVGYLVRRGKYLLPTPKGEALIALLPELLRSPELTARWEESLAEIEAGRGSPKRFMSDIEREVAAIVDMAKKQDPAPELEPFRHRFSSNSRSRGKGGRTVKRQRGKAVSPGARVPRRRHGRQ
ncbi:MAG: DNA topoisomerase 3 [Bacillota bacterium]